MYVFRDKEGALHSLPSAKLKSLPKGGGLIHAENTLVDNSIFKTVWDGNACWTQCRETKTVSRTFSGFSSVGGPCCRLVLRRRCQDCPCLSTQSQILIFGPTATFKTDQQKNIKLSLLGGPIDETYFKILPCTSPNWSELRRHFVQR